MDQKKLLNEWYGMPEKDSFHSPWRLHPIDSLPTEVRSAILNLSREMQDYISREYTPPENGSTDEDFIKWALKQTSKPMRAFYHWKSTEAFPRIMDTLGIDGVNDWANTYKIVRLLNDLYTYNSQRNDRLFRIIELNEFLLRGSEGQTLEEFLRTDTEYQDKCRGIVISSSEYAMALIQDDLPEFLKFGPKIALKTRHLLLPYTVEEMSKIVDYKNNPVLRVNPKGSGTVEYAKMFIEAAINGPSEDQMILTEVASDEILNLVASAFLSSGSMHYWQKVKTATSRTIPETVQVAMEEIMKMDSNNPALTRDFAYLIHTGVLEKLNPDEVMALAHGYDKPHRWATANKGKGTVNIITELIYEKKVDPVQILRLIAYTLVKNEKMIKIDKDFPWETLDDVPPVWSYEALAANAKCKLVVPSSIRMMTG